MGACPASEACGSILCAPRDITQLFPHAGLCLQALSCLVPCSHQHPDFALQFFLAMAHSYFPIHSTSPMRLLPPACLS